MFENKMFEGIYYSRFVASWFKSGGKINNKFKEWLKSFTINGKQVPEDIIQEIYCYADNGKLELEESAKAFLAK